MLLRDCAGTGGNCAGNDSDVFSGCLTRPNHARSTETARVLVSSSAALGSERGPPVASQFRPRLSTVPPSDSPVLRLIRPPTLLSPQSATYEEHLLWAAASVCFFGFFRAGEINVPSATAYDSAVHLSWGDVSISDDGRVLRVVPKMDQYGRGVEVFIGATDNDLCPVRAVRLYVTLRGMQAGAFFCITVNPL